MKLQTTILPRRDGTVQVVGEDGQKYVFKADANGDMVCDVTDDATVAKLLATGDFDPFDAEDFDKALSLAKSAATANADHDDGDGDGEEKVNGGLPVEAKTPPATVHKAGVKGAAKPAAKSTGKKK